MKQSKYNLKKNCCVVPNYIHIEVTERCPLSCQQCYCDLHNGLEMNYDFCKQIIQEAAELGVEEILITGGEPLVYPYLLDSIEMIRNLEMKCCIATSGFGLTYEVAKDLKKAGLKKCYVSLNGSRAEIHNISRDSFEESIEAIENIKSVNMWCGINWVARKDNVYDFPELLELVNRLNVDHIDILSCKTSIQGEKKFLDKSELNWLAEVIEKLYKSGYIGVELCYPELSYILLKEELHPILHSCIAGRYFMDVQADGSFSPCRHIGYKEYGKTILEYWNNSQNLKDIRLNSKTYENSCRF